MVYRVIIKISYREAYFDFETIEGACGFVKIAAEHTAGDDDGNKATILLRAVTPDEKESEDD